MLMACIIVFVEPLLQKPQIFFHREHTNENISVLYKIVSEIPVKLETW